MKQKGQAQILMIALVIGVLALGAYLITTKPSVNSSVEKAQNKQILNFKIGKYEVLYKGGWEELNYLDTANAKSPEELYAVFSKLYPDLTDKDNEFFIQEIIIKDGTAEVYFGGDEGAITNRMGSSGPYIYTGLITFALTEDEKIKKVDFKLKTEGNHFGPTISTRDDFIYLWPTKILQDKIAKGNTKASETLKERGDISATLPDETANWKTYTNSKYNLSIQYPSEWYAMEGNGKHDDEDAIIRLRSDNNPYGGPYIGISLFDNSNNLTAKEYAEKLISQNSNVYILKEQPTYLQTSDAIMINGLTGAGPSGPSGIINDKKGHIILLYTTGLDQKIIDSIFSTFKFTN